MLSEKGRAELTELLERYPNRRAALLPICHLVQREQGYISEEAEIWISEQVDLPPVKVHEVITFYTMFHLAPVGRHHLQVCRTLSCALRGSGRLLDHLATSYGLENHGVTSDRRFSLEEVECLGACGHAPVVQVNDDYHPDLSVATLERLLAGLK